MVLISGDVRPAGQHLAGDVLQLRQWYQRLLKQGGSAAGYQKQHPICRGQVPHRLQSGFRGPDGVFIRHRMSRFIDGKAADSPLTVAIFRNDYTSLDGAAQRVIGGFGGLPPGLADRDQHRLPGAGRQLRQCTPDGSVRHRGGNGAAADILRIPAKGLQRLHIHENRSFQKTAGRRIDTPPV